MSTKAIPQARGEIVGVQYLRALAALGVVVDHAATVFGAPKYFPGHVAGGPLVHGAVGVDLFFLISGFIITIVSLGSDLRPSVSRSAFAVRRFVRIVPLMWVAIGSYAALRYFGRGVGDPMDYLRAFILTPSGNVAPANIWTLRHEAMFYLVFALTMLGGRQRPWMLAAWCLAPVVAMPLGPHLDLSPAAAELWFHLFHPLHLDFGLGALVGVWWLRRGRDVQLASPVEPAVVLTVLFVGLVGVAWLSGHALHRVDSALIAAAFGVPILLFGVVVRCPPSRIGRVAEFLGAASYSMYLFHPAIESAIGGVWGARAPDTPAWLFIPATVLAVVATTALLHVFLERPLVSLAKRLTARRPAAQPIAIPPI